MPPDTDTGVDPLPALAERAWALCPEARPHGLKYDAVPSLDNSSEWFDSNTGENYSQVQARAAIVAQGMACIFAWPAYERDAALNLIYEHGHLVPLAERVCGAIVVMAPSVPLPRPKPVEV